MTREEIIAGLQFTIDMFLFNPDTGETYTEPRNNDEAFTVDACKGAIELLEREPCEDTISRQTAIDTISEKSDEIYKTKQKGAIYPHDDFFQGMAYAGNIIKQLPPAQPKPKTRHLIKIGERKVDSSKLVADPKCPHMVSLIVDMPIVELSGSEESEAD